MWLERVLPAHGPSRFADQPTAPSPMRSADGFVGEFRPIAALSAWGSGNEWQVWAVEKVADLVQLNTRGGDAALTTGDSGSANLRTPARKLRRRPDSARTLLTVSSYWPFMVRKDSSAD